MDSQAAYERFEALAREFCKSVEEPASPQRIQSSLASLYACAVDLPAVTEPFDDCRIPGLPDSRERWKLLYQQLQPVFPKGTYHVFFTPFEEKTGEPVITTIYDDLAGIWGDLKPGLDALAAGRNDLQTAIYWDWQFGFETHWGRHAVDALMAMFHLLVNSGRDTD